MFRKRVGERSFNSSISATQGSGRRSIRLYTGVELIANAHIVLPLHLLPLKTSLKESLGQYPNESCFKFNESIVGNAVREHGVPSASLATVIAALRRGGVAYLSEGRDSRISSSIGCGWIASFCRSLIRRETQGRRIKGSQYARRTGEYTSS